MDKIKVLLVDDEYLALNLLENFIKEIPDLEIIDKVKSPIKAIDILNKTRVDLLFLDIQMPTLSGINLLKTIKNKPVTIFTTAYAEHAVDAYGLDAIDYLLKPFSFERFLQGVNKAKEQLRKSNILKSEPLTNQGLEAFLIIKSESKTIKVAQQDILYIEGLKEYVRIVCSTEKYITLMSLKELTDLLSGSGFMRVHKSYIVNLNRVRSMDGNRLELGEHKIPVSRDKKTDIMKKIFG